MSLTPRDLALERREAFNAGARFQEMLHRSSLVRRVAIPVDAAIAEAKALYPLPKIERPRVVHTRSKDGAFELHVRIRGRGSMLVRFADGLARVVIARRLRVVNRTQPRVTR